MSVSTLSRLTREISPNATKIYKARYLEPDETIEHLFRRVAGGNDNFERIMRDGDFLPNSPTLMNAGTEHEGKSTFSACFKFDVADSMLVGEDSILETARKAAAVAKWGGGVGYYFGNLRGRGKPIRSVHRVACGVVNVLKWYNGIGTHLITQGGRRELAQMGILPIDHDDIREFIHVKDKDPQGLRTFNISASITDKFMNRVEGDPTGKEGTLWNELIESAWKTGDPGVYFFDTAERTNPTPHLGQLTGTNPCGEVCLLNNEPCNLGSVNLGHFVTVNRSVDWNRLEEVVRIATRFLDNILDRNSFPHPAVTRAAALTRKLGLGACGWGDMLALLHIHYDSAEAVQLAGVIAAFIDDLALEESILLAKTKGPYPGYKEGPEARNSTRTCWAPTGTIGILMDADSGGCEPHYAYEWTRTLNAGVKEKEETITERLRISDRLEGFVPHLANDIPWHWHIEHQAAIQKHTNLAVSKTINLPNNATKEDIKNAYSLMWKLGCKGGTIFRDKCRENGEQVLNAVSKTVNVLDEPVNRVRKEVAAALAKTEMQIAEDVAVLNLVNSAPLLVVAATNGHTNGHVKKAKVELPRERDSKTHNITIAGQFDGYVHASCHDDGTLREIFFTAGKEGSTVSGLLASWAIVVSYYLQEGGSLEKLVKKFSGMRFEPAGMTGNPEIPICTSIQDYVVRWLDLRFGKAREPGHKGVTVNSGMLCPDCGGAAAYQSGCLTCMAKCGYSKCG